MGNTRDYFLGLDIGTDSVGWAVTDEKYNILKFHGNNMWGIRLFDEASTAEERRIFRTNRRRGDRRKWRIRLLQELFAEEICKVDANFFMILKESPLIVTDREDHHVYTLFEDDDFSDVDYYAEYPTIYHLRKALLTETKAFDVRLVYLALHHIMKHRGHFLFAGTVDNVTSLHTSLTTLQECLRDELEIEMNCSSEEELAEVLKNKQYTKRDKTNKVIELLNVDKKNQQMLAIVKLICGAKSKLADVFQDSSLSEAEYASISFAEIVYDEVRPMLEEYLAERYVILDIIKGVYDWSILADILEGGEVEGNNYLSVAKTGLYDKHKKDLQILKSVLKADAQVYKEFFQKAGSNNYTAYIGMTKVAGKKKSIKRCTREDFIKAVKASLTKIVKCPENEEMINYIEVELANDSFLPLQVSKDNGVIPYQIHEFELKKILQNAERYLPFLAEKDDAGLSVSDKIEKLFTFRIPYYVGPLNTHGGTNSWMIRKADGRITPWNFTEKVNLDASAEQFIRRMTNKCTYLVAEDVLPKYSLLYAEFTVWNELNNVRIGSDPLPVELRQQVYKDLFQRKKKITRTMLLNYLKCEGLKVDKEELTGIDITCNSSLTAYLDFRKIMGDRIDRYSVQQMVEKIILWITLYGNEPKMLKNVIRKHYDEADISEDELKKICRLRYQGWGRLSKKLLADMQIVNKETGQQSSVIQTMRDNSVNFMQLMSSAYTLSDDIEKLNMQNTQDNVVVSYENLLQDLPASPAIKRAIWQVVLIAEEIRKIMGTEPKKIFVEVARGAAEKVRTNSRKDQLIKLYENCKNEERDWKAELESRPEHEFRSIKLYLYYTQMGKCMYSGEAIDLSRLSDASVYDRDHIYPQSKTKDDSIDNLVLVKREINAKKSDGMISSEIQSKMHNYWDELKRKGFISEEKYRRLVRKTPLSDEELAGFINRQLVEARQSSKLAISLLKQMYRDTEIVYVKARLASEFRKEQLKLVKSRSVNDYHHAVDAYLNIVVGNVYNERFTSNPLEWLKKNRDYNYSLNQIFNHDIKKKDRIIWQRGQEGTIQTVRKNVEKRNVQYTRLATTNKGELFNQQLVRKSDHPTIPIKKGRDVSVYGGYKSRTPAYFMLVESDGKKGKRKRSIEAVYLYRKEELEKNPEKYIEFAEKEYGLVNPKIIIPRIKINAYMVIDGFPMHLRGTTGKQLIFQSAAQLRLPQEDVGYIKKIEKYILKNQERKDKRVLLEISEYDGITKEENLQMYDKFCNKFADTIYKQRMANPLKLLQEKRCVYEDLSVEQQCIVLNEILHLLQCKPLTADLSLIGGGKNVGKICKIKELSSIKEIKLIHQSVTGLYAQEIDLLEE